MVSVRLGDTHKEDSILFVLFLTFHTTKENGFVLRFSTVMLPEKSQQWNLFFWGLRLSKNRCRGSAPR